MTVINSYDNIDFNKIHFDKPIKQGVIYYSPIRYDNNEFFIQTPIMNMKDDIQNIIQSKTTMDASTKSNVDNLTNFFLRLDDVNINTTFKNNKEWFGKEIPKELLDGMYKRAISYTTDKKQIFSFKIPRLKEKIKCSIYDQYKNIISLDKINDSTDIIFILHIKGLKFLKQEYYCDFYISQIKVNSDQTRYSILNTYSFNDEYEEEELNRDLEKDIELDEDIMSNLKEKLETQNKIKLLKKTIKDCNNEIAILEEYLNTL